MRYIEVIMGNSDVNEIYDKSVIRQGENNATQLNVTLSTDFIGYSYKMLLQLNSNTPIVTPELVAENNVISFVLSNALTSESGDLKIEIQAYNSDNYLMKASIFVLKIKPTMDGSETVIMPESYVPWYTLAVAEATKATEQATIATQKAVEADTSADNALVSEQNAKASEDASKLSETNAKSSEDKAKISETNAKGSETTTTQTMTDYLAMLGKDVATLTGGKLTPSQIPDISINSTFTVTNVSEITGLTAQEGDVAIVVPVDVVTDTYMLASSDPTILSNWKKLGVSYVAECGHSLTADSATNANMINNKRIVAMTQAQYDVAVKDPDTIYVVSP